MRHTHPISTTSFLTFHALGWLCLSCGVGLLLALLLMIPSLNSVLAPLTYGRWIPVHLNGTLYGWCFLPLIGLLFAFYLEDIALSRPGQRAVELWSISLGFGCLTWLAGGSSGKLFMEWAGPARFFLSVNMLFLAGVLGWAIIKQARQDSAVRMSLKLLLWVLLLPVPFLMYWAADPSLFPPINPDSGGATGGSLLVSSLGAVSIMWLTPFMLRLPHRHTLASIAGLAGLQVVHYGLFTLLTHGDVSHHEPTQIVGLLSIALWAPLLVFHFKHFDWPAQSRLWLWSFCLWAVFLIITANVMFLPGLLDQWKFTHMVVGHTHAAMAGMLSSFNIMVLICLNRNGPWADCLGQPQTFWIWNLGTLAHVASLKLFGLLEGQDPGVLYYRPLLTQTFFTFRLLAGVLMLGAALIWFTQGLRGWPGTKEAAHA